MQSLHAFINWLNTYLWGPPMLILLFGTHLFLTFRLRFLQRHIGTAIRLSFSRDREGSGDISQFAALATALAATIGTGNIVGVATAVALGGPGAVLWMWLTGVFGIATKYSEALLAVKYRVKTSDGSMLGGPMYALAHGLNMKWLAVLFCVFTALAAFGIGNMVQANSIASLAKETLNVPPVVSGLVMTVITAMVILGGIQSIARVCTLLVPFMAIFYILGCVIILVINASYIGQAVTLIFQHAFSAKAAGGGFAGATVMMAMRFGIARGLFSNESGLGSAPIVAGTNTQPGAPGAGFGHGHLLGHGLDLCLDRAGPGHQHPAPARRDGRFERRQPDQCGICAYPRDRSHRAHGRVADVRLFNHFGLVLLRREGGGISVREGRRAAVSLSMGVCGFSWFSGNRADDLGYGRCHERAHGDPEPDLSFPFKRRNRCRDEEISMGEPA